MPSECLRPFGEKVNERAHFRGQVSAVSEDSVHGCAGSYQGEVLQQRDEMPTFEFVVNQQVGIMMIPIAATLIDLNQEYFSQHCQVETMLDRLG